MSRMLEEYPGYLILLHPNIPKPLHGLNPRTLDPVWWEVRRREAYRRFNDHCWACRTHKSKSRYRKYLDAHECYVINYQEGTATFVGVSALCYSCHNYIHDGRMLALCAKRRFPVSRYNAIITHGNRILSKNGIDFKKQPGEQLMVPLFDNPFVEEPGRMRANTTPRWSQWRLILGETTYRPLYNSEEEWRKHYK